MSTIPASEIVNVVPSVISAGGTGLNGIGLMLSNDSGRIPVGTVLGFPNLQAVESYFGPGSYKAAEAAIYFSGFAGKTTTPSNLLFAQYNQSSVPAWMRGGNVSSLTLAQLQAISGSLDILIDGVAHNASALNLSSATSFSSAAALITSAINGSLTTLADVTGAIAPETFSVTASIAGNVMTVTNVASGTIVNGAAISGTGVTSGTTITGQLSGTPGGIGTYAVSKSQVVASETISGTYGQLTVSAVNTGALAVGQTLAGTSVDAGTMITQLGTGTGGIGTYYVNLTQTVASEDITSTGTAAVVTFDSISGGFVVTSGVAGAASTIAAATGTVAANLMLTSATGAVLSQGADPATPAAFMSSLIVSNQAWVNFMTLFDPDGGSGNAQKQAFAAWKNTALGGNRFGYVCWDPDDSPAVSNDAASSLGQILKADGDSGTILVWENAATSDTGLAAFVLGWAASINYIQTNGRANLAFRMQVGIIANVTDPLTAANLTANGYNFYGAYGTGTANFIWFREGQISGPYKWADSYLTQIWFNTLLQVTLLNLFANTLSIPFSIAGASIIEQALQGPIQQGLNFGAFGPDDLSPEQIAEVNNAAGIDVSTPLQSLGYYLQVAVPPATVRSTRGPWPITLWYIDRGSVQSIDLSSVALQ